MRIRKHAQISPLVYEEDSSLKPGGAVVETYVCKLNQSPWDTIIFPSSEYPVDPTASPQPPPPPPPLLYPVDGEDNSSMAANGSTFSDCPEAQNSELSMNFALDDDEKCEKVVDRNCNFEIDDEENVLEENSKSPCGRKKVVKELMSNYPVSHHRTSSSSSHLKRRNNKLTKRSVSVSRRIRPKKPPSTSDPNEFYYYSGFGPRWGRRRGPSPTPTTKVETEEESYSSESLNIGPTNTEVVKVEAEESYSSASLKNNNVVEEATTPEEERIDDSSPSRICNGGFDYVEDEFDDDDDDEEDDYVEDIGEIVRKKRGRKPIKARSLKSLM